MIHVDNYEINTRTLRSTNQKADESPFRHLAHIASVITELSMLRGAILYD